MPGLFCGVSDPERARIIAHHFDGLAVTLHGHHHSEDADLWPLVLQRVGVSASAPVESMQAQHVELADALDSLQTGCASGVLHRLQASPKRWPRTRTNWFGC